jgi:anthranilate/para-aminobenzoate synthase component I
MNPPMMQITPPQPGPSVIALLAALYAHSPDLALLHSAEDVGWSVIGVNPIAHCDDLNQIQPALESPPVRVPADANDLPIGWIGTISYERGTAFEIGDDPRNHPPLWPAANWHWYATYYCYNHQTAEWTIASSATTPPVIPTTAAADAALNALPPIPSPTEIAPPNADHYRAAVTRALNYLAAGDIYQVNLAQRWSIRTSAHPIALYAALCQTTPAAYAAFISHKNRVALCASPELFLEGRGNRITTKPIKGTRPRNPNDPIFSATQRKALLTAAKDRAELAMIVDLLRNDLGRIATPGTVHVTHPRILTELPTLFHTHAEITAELATTSWPEIFRATLPGGSITGAPKIRAMQIIRELEPHPRGLYCGNIGLLKPNGDATLNIAIRTIQLTNGIATIHAGAGIVADSTPENEQAETLAKAAAPLRAVGLKT